MRLPSARRAGRNPLESGQTSTPGWAPSLGWKKTASQVPSGVLISTSASITGSSRAEAESVSAPQTIAEASATTTRRRSEPRRNGLRRLLGGAHRNDLEVHQVIPIPGPLFQRAFVGGFHDLEAAMKL